jgi:LSD1 subclass zinc finger protein
MLMRPWRPVSYVEMTIVCSGCSNLLKLLGSRGIFCSNSVGGREGVRTLLGTCGGAWELRCGVEVGERQCGRTSVFGPPWIGRVGSRAWGGLASAAGRGPSRCSPPHREAAQE